MRTLAKVHDTEEILRRLKALRPDSVAQWGRMSAHQMICHLSDGYRLLTGAKTTQLAPTPLPRPVMKLIALYAPLRWPAGILTTPELDQHVDGTKPAEFAADVEALERLVKEVATDRRGQMAGLLHPIFGRMSEPAWLRWGYLHADHHLRQFGA